jgi:hypothetical protein
LRAVVSISTTHSTFLKTNLTTTNTAYSLAKEKEKEPQLAHLKTKHGRLLVGDLQPWSCCGGMARNQTSD